MRRILAVHDVSGLGRCGLSVVMPVVSAFSCQVCPLPTALLSASPRFKGFVMNENPDFEKTLRHYNELKVDFDCIYTGFFASANQIRILAEFIKRRKAVKPVLVIVDPVMGDHGQLYKVVSLEQVLEMKNLAGLAEIITPNITEGKFLLDKNMEPDKILVSLAERYPRSDIILKKVALENGHAANMLYSQSTKKITLDGYPLLPTEYPGSGDLFASIFIGRLLRGSSRENAFVSAGFDTFTVIRRTLEAGSPPEHGLEFEGLTTV